MRKDLVPEVFGETLHQPKARCKADETVAAQERLGEPGGNLKVLAVRCKRLGRKLADSAPPCPQGDDRTALRRRGIVWGSGRIRGALGVARLGPHVAQPTIQRVWGIVSAQVGPCR